jgi:ketosteroid isomerase-like protein
MSVTFPRWEMASEDVDLLLDLWRAWNANDDVAAIASDYWHPDIEWHIPSEWGATASTVTRGREAVIRQSREFAQHMGHLQIEVVELVDAGDEVLACLRYHGRGAKSTVPVAIPAFHVTRVEGGRVRRVRVFVSRDDAARAAGLIADADADA